MHLGEPTKQALPDKWLADLLAKALLLEYQHPEKPTKPKGKRCGKKTHLHSKGKCASCKSKGNEKVGSIQPSSSTVSSKDAVLAATPSRVDSNFQQPPEHSSWHLQDVPVFHLFAQVKRLLGRVPIPLHVNNLGTPRGKPATQAPPVLDGTALTASNSPVQHSSDSDGLVCKLLSLPSFGRVVYRSNSTGSIHNADSTQRGSDSAFLTATGLTSSQQMLLQGHASHGTKPTGLEFDSQFESGNLQKAVQVSGQEYELWLSPDSSTNGHTQWYFFSIANGRAAVPYRLHIHNFRKAHSLYSKGLQPLLHSSKQAALTVSCL
ncbi:hypothetical protein ABBQ32_002101 [Trebouxia sp. C0010 RCD-2024]